MFAFKTEKKRAIILLKKIECKKKVWGLLQDMNELQLITSESLTENSVIKNKASTRNPQPLFPPTHCHQLHFYHHSLYCLPLLIYKTILVKTQ